MSVGTPIVNSGNLYVNGLELSWIDGTHIQVYKGEARDSTNVNDINLSATILINAAIQGAGGLDQGALANNTFYAVYVIGNSLGNAHSSALISTNTTSPALPYNYDMFRRVGFVLTSGAAAILEFWQEQALGGISISNSSRRMWYDAPISVLAATAQAAFTAQVLTAAIPLKLSGTEVTFNVDLLPNAAANFVELRPTGSTAAAGMVKLSGDVGGVHHFDQVRCVCAADATPHPSIDYITDAATTVALTVSAYVDYL